MPDSVGGMHTILLHNASRIRNFDSVRIFGHDGLRLNYSSYNGRYVIGSGELAFETMWTKASDTSIREVGLRDAVLKAEGSSDVGLWRVNAMKRFADSLSVIDCNLLQSSRFRGLMAVL